MFLLGGCASKPTDPQVTLKDNIQVMRDAIVKVVTDKDRKRMIRLIIEDVTLTKADSILLQIRFKGGALETHHLPLPKRAFEEKINSKS